MKPIRLKHFKDVGAALSYVTSELGSTLRDDLLTLATDRSESKQRAELRHRIHDVNAVASLANAAPNMLTALEFLADQWADEFDNDKPVNGADFVQWFGECRRLHILPAIAKAKEQA